MQSNYLTRPPFSDSQVVWCSYQIVKYQKIQKFTLTTTKRYCKSLENQQHYVVNLEKAFDLTLVKKAIFWCKENLWNTIKKEFIIHDSLQSCNCIKTNTNKVSFSEFSCKLWKSCQKFPKFQDKKAGLTCVKSANKIILSWCLYY